MTARGWSPRPGRGRRVESARENTTALGGFSSQLAVALRAEGFGEDAISRACGLLKRICGDVSTVLAALLEARGYGAKDAVAYARAILRTPDGVPEERLREAVKLLDAQHARAVDGRAAAALAELVKAKEGGA